MKKMIAAAALTAALLGTAAFAYAESEPQTQAPAGSEYQNGYYCPGYQGQSRGNGGNWRGCPGMQGWQNQNANK